MPIDSPHPDYSDKLARWQKNRDASLGEDVIKSRGQAYLLGPGGYTDAEYTRYVQRAKWFGATARTIAGTVGAVMQKNPTIESSPQVDDHLQNVTLTGIDAVSMAGKILAENELQGRYGVLLDYSAELRRPYWNGFACESIISWHEVYIGGEPKLMMVTLKECVERMDGDEIKRVDRYRRCHINADGQYEVVVYEESSDVSNGRMRMSEVERYFPTRRLRALDFIPIVIFGSEDLTPSVDKGPLDDLIDVNFAYYRHSADYEHALFLTALPKYVITGHSLPEGERVPVGSMDAWVFPNPDARAYLLEFQGQGLQSHERAVASDKLEMATLGARLLEEAPTTQETLGAVQLRHSGETGRLKTLANLVSQGLTKLLRWHHWWHGVSENLNDERFSFTLNTDFSTSRLQPQELQALMQLWQGGAISRETLFWNLKQGEIVPDERTAEDEQALIELEAPARIPFGDIPQEQGEDADDDEEEAEEPEATAA